MNNLPLIVLAQFAYVFLLGYQSRNVRDSQYLGASICSLCIGVCGAVIVPLIVDAVRTGDPVILVWYVLTGPVAICSAMWIHDKNTSRKT